MKRLLAVLLLAGAGLAAWPFLSSKEGPHPYQGWVEADMLFVGAEGTGRLSAVAVDEGQEVAAGAPLFSLDSSSETAAVAAAQAALSRAEAERDLAQAPQKRPEEIDILQASEREAQARLELAEQDLERTRTLVRRGTTSEANLDTAMATRTANSAALDNIRSQIALARLPARPEALRQAQQAVAAAQAELHSAQAALKRRSVAAPASGRIETVYYRAGEVVPAGRPVVALLPPGNIRLRFFMPETEIGDVALNQPVRIACDGCQPQDGRITFIAGTAEFTPPEIYSREERAKLVYRVEATPVDPRVLRPGQPADVTLGPRP